MSKIKTISHQLKRAFVITAVTLLSLSALLGIIIILIPSSASITYLRIIGTTATLGVFSSLIVSNLSRFDSESRLLKALAAIALMTSLIATALTLLLIWGAFERNCHSSVPTDYYDQACYTKWYKMMDLTYRILWICVILAFTASIDGRYLDYPAYNNTVIRIFRGITVATATLMGSLLTLNTLGVYFDELWRVLIISGILLVLGLIATPILVMLEKNRHRQLVGTNSQASEQDLRAKIEQEVRAQIAAEEQAKAAAAAATYRPLPDDDSEPAPSEDTPSDNSTDIEVSPIDKNAPFA